MRRACSTCAASRTPSIDNCQIVGSGKNGLSLERVGGRIERTTISGAADAGIYSVEGNGPRHHRQQRLRLRQWRHPGASLAGRRRRHDGHRQPRRAHLGAQWRHRPERQRHQRLPRRQGRRLGQHRQRLRLLRHPRQQRQQPADRRQHLHRVRRDRALRRIRLRGRRHQQQHRRRRGERHFGRQFRRGRPRGRLLGQSRAQSLDRRAPTPPTRRASASASASRPTRPSPATWSTTRRSTASRSAGDPTCATSWRPATSSARRRTGIAVTVVDGAGPAVISDNVISGATNGAVVGYRWRDAVTGDLASGGSSGYAHLTVERNHVG